MKKFLGIGLSLILCLVLCGSGCKKAQEEPKKKIEEKVEKEDAGAFEQDISEEVEKIPAPAEGWGEEPEEPMIE